MVESKDLIDSICFNVPTRLNVPLFIHSIPLQERPSFSEVILHYIPLDKSLLPIKTGAKGEQLFSSFAAFSVVIDQI